MKIKFYLSLAVAICLSAHVAIGQIDIVPVSDPMSDRTFKTIVYDSKLYASENGASFLRAYNGSSVTHYTYPVVSGNQLSVNDHDFLKEPFTVFNNKLYTVLSHYAVDQYLYSFNGSVFTAVPLPHHPVSNPVVYNGQLHVLTETPTGLELLRYDGSTVSVALPIAATVIGAEFELFVAGEYLYILFSVDTPDGAYARIVRYDGSSSITLPDILQWNVSDIVGMPGTPNVLIVQDAFMIYHFDGTTLTTLDSEYGYQTTGILVWQNAFYYQRSFEPVLPGTVYKYKDGILSAIALPDGAQPMFDGEMVVYNDELYIPANASDGTITIYKYNGSSASLFYYFAGLIEPISPATWLGVRNGNLLIIPYTDDHDYAFEYNGSTITLLQTTDGAHITKYITTIGCNHFWGLNYYSIPTGYQYQIGAENALSCGMPIIPSSLWEYERFRIATFTNNRKWSWAGIDLDFAIDTLCAFPPLCPDPQIQVSLYDKPGNAAWQKTFDASFHEKFPVADKPYALLTGIDNYHAEFQNIVSLDGSLVPKGVEQVTIDIKPDEHYFNLDVKTKHNKKVPFTISLLDAKGKTLWKENLVAPVNKKLSGTVREPGSSLRIAPASRSCKHFLAHNIRYYPNPVRGKLNIDIDREDDGAERLSTSVQIAITDFKGSKIVSEQFEDAGTKQLDLGGYKPGLYILTITAGDEIRKELIQLK